MIVSVTLRIVASALEQRRVWMCALCLAIIHLQLVAVFAYRAVDSRGAQLDPVKLIERHAASGPETVNNGNNQRIETINSYFINPGGLGFDRSKQPENQDQITLPFDIPLGLHQYHQVQPYIKAIIDARKAAADIHVKLLRNQRKIWDIARTENTANHEYDSMTARIGERKDTLLNGGWGPALVLPLFEGGKPSQVRHCMNFVLASVTAAIHNPSKTSRPRSSSLPSLRRSSSLSSLRRSSSLPSPPRSSSLSPLVEPDITWRPLNIFAGGNVAPANLGCFASARREHNIAIGYSTTFKCFSLDEVVAMANPNDNVREIIRRQAGDLKQRMSDGEFAQRHHHSEQALTTYLALDAENCLGEETRGNQARPCRIAEALGDDLCRVEMLVIDLVSIPNDVCDSCSNVLNRAYFVKKYKEFILKSCRSKSEAILDPKVLIRASSFFEYSKAPTSLVFHDSIAPAVKDIVEKTVLNREPSDVNMDNVAFTRQKPFDSRQDKRFCVEELFETN